MKSDIIDEILSVEERAQSRVRDAESASRDKLMRTRSEANTLVHDMVEKEREACANEYREAEKAYQLDLENYEASLDDSERPDRESLEKIADRIVRLVVKSSLPGVVL